MKHLDQDPSLQRLLRQFLTLSFQEMEDIFLVVIIWLSRFVTSFSMFFYLCFYLQYTNTFGQTQNSNWMLLHQKSLHDVILISIFNYLQVATASMREKQLVYLFYVASSTCIKFESTVKQTQRDYELFWFLNYA